jgi:hypothetical protein
MIPAAATTRTRTTPTIAAKATTATGKNGKKRTVLGVLALSSCDEHLGGRSITNTKAYHETHVT